MQLVPNLATALRLYVLRKEVATLMNEKSISGGISKLCLVNTFFPAWPNLMSHLSCTCEVFNAYIFGSIIFGSCVIGIPGFPPCFPQAIHGRLYGCPPISSTSSLSRELEPRPPTLAMQTLITSKEKHSQTRKLVGYRNWRQRWCKKEGNKVWRKG